MIQYEFSQILVDPDDMPIPEYLARMGDEGWMLVQLDRLEDEEIVGIIMQRPKGLSVYCSIN